MQVIWSRRRSLLEWTTELDYFDLTAASSLGAPSSKCMQYPVAGTPVTTRSV